VRRDVQGSTDHGDAGVLTPPEQGQPDRSTRA